MEDIIYQLPTKRKAKSRNGILYLLMSKDGYYKYGYTRNNVKNRLTWANRKYGHKFDVLATRIVDKPHRTETIFRWSTLNYVEIIDDYLELFRLKPGYMSHNDIINIFNKVVWYEPQIKLFFC